jgi:hypothetical protein
MRLKIPSGSHFPLSALICGVLLLCLWTNNTAQAPICSTPPGLGSLASWRYFENVNVAIDPTFSAEQKGIVSGPTP